MEMDNSLRDSVMQLVQMQTQSISAINQLTSTVAQNKGIYSVPSPAALTSYTNYAGPAAATPTNPFSPSPQAAARFNSYASQVMPGGIMQNAKTILAANEGGLRMNQEQAQMVGSQMGGNMANAIMAGGSAVTSGLGSFAGYAMVPGMVAGTAAAAAGGVAGGAVTSVMLDQAKQAQAYNQFMIQNSYKFINPLESNNNKGVGGFSREERWSAASMLRRVDADMNVSDKDTMDILKGVTDAGLMKSATDMKSFEKKFKTLVSTTKEMALSLNASFKESVEFMGEMQKRGVSEGNFDYFAAQAKVTGSFTGMSAMQAGATAMNMASGITAGTSMNYETTLAGSGYSLALYDEVYEDAKKGSKNGNQVATNLKNVMVNMGGPEAAAQSGYQMSNSLMSENSLLSQMLILGYNPESNKIDEDYLMKVIKGKDGDTIGKMINQKENMLGEGVTESFLMNKKSNASQISAENQLTLLGIGSKMITKGANVSDQARYSLAYNVSEEQAALLNGAASYQEEHPEFEKEYRESVAKQETSAKTVAGASGVFTKPMKLFRTIGNIIGDAGQGFTKGWSNMGEDVAEWGNGVNLENWTYSGSKYDKKTISSILRGVGSDNVMNKIETEKTNKSINSLRRTALWKEGFASGKKKEQYADAIQTYDNIEATMEGFSNAGTLIAKASGKKGKSFLSHYAYGNANWGGRSLSEAEDMYDAGKADLQKMIGSVRAGSQKSQDEFLSNLVLSDSERKKYSKMFDSKKSDKTITESLLKAMNTNGETSGKEGEANSKMKEGNDAMTETAKEAKRYADAVDDLKVIFSQRADKLEQDVAKMNSGKGRKGIFATGYNG